MPTCAAQARSQDFVQEGPTWRGPKVPPTKNQKLLGFGALFLGSGPIYFLFSYFYYNILLCFPLRGGGHGPRAPSPLGYVHGAATIVRAHDHDAPGHWEYEMSGFARPCVTIIRNLSVP